MEESLLAGSEQIIGPSEHHFLSFLRFVSLRSQESLERVLSREEASWRDLEFLAMAEF